MANPAPTVDQVRQAFELAHELTGASLDPSDFDRFLAEYAGTVIDEAIQAYWADLTLTRFPETAEWMKKHATYIRRQK